MPSPWSAIANRIERSPFAIESRTGPPWGEYLIALSTRLTSTWRSWPGSAITLGIRLRHVEVERDVLGQVRARGLEDGRRDLGRIARARP